MPSVDADPSRASERAHGVSEALTPDGDAAQGVPKTPAEFFERVHEIKEFLEEFVDTSAVPGASIALGVGEFTRFEGFGWANIEAKTPVTPETRFRIGSVSKVLTAAAMGLMVEAGDVDLDAVIQEYVPEFPRKEYPITLRHLATHQAGIHHYRGDEALSNRRFGSVLEAISVFAEDPLVAEPGSAFNYSTYGYTLLSAALERASGQTFLDLMQERVLEPIGMTHTGPEISGSLHPDQAVGYEPDYAGGVRIPPETDLSNKWAGGGYVSNAADLLRFARAHLTGSFLRQETLELLWQEQTTADGTPTGHGIAWQTGVMETGGEADGEADGETAGEADGRRFVAAGGNAIGGTTVMVAFPDEEVVMVFMTNIGNAPIRGVPQRLVRILLGVE
ncbi:MAG: serine hydrolase domain-containing protein [Gemmatimonadota bacterium]